MYNLPNLLTLSRIVVIPVIFLSLYIQGALWALLAAVLFIIASITDYFDGYLARARGETSALGRLMDPIADKLLVTSALVVLLAKPDMVVTRWSFVPVVVILCREILVSGLREFLREVNVGLPVSRLAKWKTGFQMTALSMMLLKGFWYWGGIGEVLLWIAGVLTFVTGYQYFQKSLDYICETEKCAKVPPMPKIISELKIKNPVMKKRGRPAALHTTEETAKQKPQAKAAKSAVKRTPVAKKKAKSKAVKKKAA
ncbi:MAG: CDP-diacylglycerol--glycerol-3-phosphate 3-phosphatidyltransferase [Alphaproteobacteria bacterium]|nr:CDP-diacylglycerol--glycerol-3-phosphate 3-phosphatidyltransferase [Alphaproteobacteria bacterium]